jgi:hypothetical protein
VTNASIAECQQSLIAVAKAANGRQDSTAFAGAILGIAGAISVQAMSAALGNSFSFDADDRVTVRAPSDTSLIPQSMCDALNGLGASQIVKKADSLAVAAATAYERRAAQSYVEALRRAAAAYASARDSLAGFRVLSAQLRQSRGFIGLEATIVLTVENGTSFSVSRAYFHGRAVSEGRQIPWIDEDFNHTIPGGIEPGERATWRLSPNMFQGAWSNVIVPAAARFEVEVTQLDGANHEPLWGGARFTRADQRLLDSLSARFAR